MKSSPILIWLLYLLVGCNDTTQEKQLQEAYSFHEKSLAIREKLENLLKSAEHLAPTQYDELRAFLEEWDNSFVEVPGFEHTHDHDHQGHDHHHAHKAPELTPQQHLQLQQHLYGELMEAYKSVKK
ncbi:hypothetical protein [Lunatimonas salinarum]|uniref:hypothetical protein n=1 Tax=Lunatimonas salinarum TaxID=1774590 RepID=UPI001ADFB131|nr:hypothetical protein [Lunatimonas salinarum]